MENTPTVNLTNKAKKHLESHQVKHNPTFRLAAQPNWGAQPVVFSYKRKKKKNPAAYLNSEKDSSPVI
jgi:hypothetical protein